MSCCGHSRSRIKDICNKSSVDSSGGDLGVGRSKKLFESNKFAPGIRVRVGNLIDVARRCCFKNELADCLQSLVLVYKIGEIFFLEHLNCFYGAGVDLTSDSVRRWM